MTKLMICLLTLLGAINSYANLKIMSYNAHNLFDHLHDLGKEDFTYTPIKTAGRKEYCETIQNERYKKDCLENNWTKEKVDLKLSQLTKVIKAAGHLDVLVLVEVENENIVSQLAQKTGFSHFVMTNSPDKRGIDVALLYNENKFLKFESFKEHIMKGAYFSERPTRNILEANFKYAGKKLSIFGNHWPSQAAPGWVRTKVATTIKEVINQKINNGEHIVMTGDFNVIPADHPHPFKDVLYTGENTRLFDVHQLHMAALAKIDFRLANKVPLGTYFYATKMEWNLLDRFFVSQNLIDDVEVEADIMSYKIFTPDFIKTSFTYKYEGDYNYGTTINGIPFRSNHETTLEDEAGYSDHFPVILELK